MAGEIHKCTVAGVNDSYPGESIDTARIAGAINTKIAGLTCSSVANALAERLPKVAFQDRRSGPLVTNAAGVGLYTLSGTGSVAQQRGYAGAGRQEI